LFFYDASSEHCHPLAAGEEEQSGGIDDAGSATIKHRTRVRHMPVVEPRGATLTALKVEARDDGGWVAQCIVDV
jgi:SHS2 domain-containing protein